ncbi:RnfH family protein [Vreelandella arcis]|nr:RnfH family protein [Halomonas arcis]
MAADLCAIEVAFGLPHKQRLVALEVPSGTTAREAVALADLPHLFPELPRETFDNAPLGIFGQAIRDPARHVVAPGDRVEVYRPLLIDPKVARRERAKRQAGSAD